MLMELHDLPIGERNTRIVEIRYSWVRPAGDES